MWKNILPILVLTLLTACGGGGSKSTQSTTATRLTYMNPMGAGFRLMRNATLSTPTTLVLDLYGPSGTEMRGVALFLSTEAARLEWVPPQEGTSPLFVLDRGIVPLGTAPQLRYEQVDASNRGLFEAGLFQKGGTATVIGDEPLLSVAVRLKAASAPGAAALGPQAGRQVVMAKPDGSVASVVLSVGSLQVE